MFLVLNEALVRRIFHPDSRKKSFHLESSEFNFFGDSSSSLRLQLDDWMPSILKDYVTDDDILLERRKDGLAQGLPFAPLFTAPPHDDSFPVFFGIPPFFSPTFVCILGVKFSFGELREGYSSFLLFSPPSCTFVCSHDSLSFFFLLRIIHSLRPMLPTRRRSTDSLASRSSFFFSRRRSGWLTSLRKKNLPFRCMCACAVSLTRAPHGTT